MSRSFGVATVALSLALVVSACTTAVSGVPLAAGGVINREEPSEIDPSFINNTDGGDIDKLAATVVRDVENYWQETFPATFGGKKWEDLRGGYYSVDTKDDTSPAPPCTEQASDVEGNAFYCPTADVIAWDRAALLPVLKETYGEASVMLVLAHEMGHAVQRRAGITPAAERADPRRYPTILLEAQADCYAGAFVRWVTENKAKHLRVDQEALDPALEAMVAFRDPVGTSQTADGAHGDAFDRVSAFQDGFDKTSELCAGMTVENRQFTTFGFQSAQDRAAGGNMDFPKTVEGVEANVNEYLTAELTKVGKQWTKPKLEKVGQAPECAPGDQGPIVFCENGTIDIETEGQLPELHKQIGDWSTGTLMASRYGMAVLKTLGKPLAGEEAQRSVLCVAGAYSKQLLLAQDGKFFLSPGDLDEAVQILLRFDYAARDIEGNAPETGFARVAGFRTGAVGGFEACKLA